MADFPSITLLTLRDNHLSWFLRKLVVVDSIQSTGAEWMLPRLPVAVLDFFLAIMMSDFAMPSLRWRLAAIACFAFILVVSGLLIAQDQPVKTIPSTDVFPSAAPVRAEHLSEAREPGHEGPADSSLRLGIGDLLEF